MFYTIYKITNQINGKFYIGSHKTKNLNDDYMGSGKYLKYAQEKYGIENFTKEILFVFDTPELMYEKEAEIVNEDFISEENTYNIKIGGFGGWDFINKNEIMHNGMSRNEFNKMVSPFSKFSEEKRQEILNKASISVIEKGSWKNGINTIKEKYPQGTFSGKCHSEETKRKIGEKNSVNQQGEKNSQFGTTWIWCKDQGNKKVRKDSLQEYLDKGWEKKYIPGYKI